MDTGIYFSFYFMMQMDSFFKDKIQRYNDKKKTTFDYFLISILLKHLLFCIVKN